MIRQLAVGFAIGVLALFGSATVAFAQVQDPVPIGPNQSFVGLVNGSRSKAVIEMACFGPSRPGEYGHPLAGQTLEVSPVGPVANPVAWGFTGTARQIEATYAISNTLEDPARLVQLVLREGANLDEPFVPMLGEGGDPVHAGRRRTARASVEHNRHVRTAAVDGATAAKS